MRGLRIKLRRAEDGEGFDCLVTVGEFTIGAASDDKLSALNAATGLATDLVRVIEQNPALSMLLPPQATAALQALRVAANAARAGKLADVVNIAPSAVKAVRSILKNIF
jgi:predicted nucleic acid-binding protein